MKAALISVFALRAAGLAALVCAGSAAWADTVYRCQEGGRVVYQQSACFGAGRATDLTAFVQREPAPSDQERAQAERIAQRQGDAADALQREREAFERRALSQGPAGIRQAAGGAAARGDAAGPAGARASRGSASRSVTLRRAQAKLGRVGPVGRERARGNDIDDDER